MKFNWIQFLELLLVSAIEDLPTLLQVAQTAPAAPAETQAALNTVIGQALNQKKAAAKDPYTPANAQAWIPPAK